MPCKLCTASTAASQCIALQEQQTLNAGNESTIAMERERKAQTLLSRLQEGRTHFGWVNHCIVEVVGPQLHRHRKLHRTHSVGNTARTRMERLRCLWASAADEQSGTALTGSACNAANFAACLAACSLTHQSQCSSLIKRAQCFQHHPLCRANGVERTPLALTCLLPCCLAARCKWLCLHRCGCLGAAAHPARPHDRVTPNLDAITPRLQPD